MTSVHDYDVRGLAAAIRAGELSPREAAEASIARIEELDGELNAVPGRRFDEALAAIDGGLPDGPLRGVPTLVKPLNADVAGMPTTRGSRLWADDVAARDSELVRRYRAAGMVVLGTTNLPELGFNASTEPALQGPTHNPWRHGRSPGGSSGGAAAAVASGMVPVAHASDGGGSIRIPAAMCGLFGLKPSRGRVSPAPYPVTLAAPNGVQHVLTRTVADSALLLDVTAGVLPGEAYGVASPEGTFLDAVARDPGPLRVGLMLALDNGPDTHPDCVWAAQDAARLCEGLGHTVVPLDASWDSTHLQATSGLLMGMSLAGSVAERLAALGRELESGDLEPFTAVLLEHYGSVTGTDAVRALEEAQVIGWQVGRDFDDVDVLLTPMFCRPTPEHGFLDTADPAALYERATLYSGWTAPFNVTGMPAMSVPFGTDASGMPAGVHFVADLGREALLLSLAGQLEAAAPWPLLAPV